MKYEANSCSFNRSIGLREGIRFSSILIKLLDKSLFFVQQSTIVALNFLLCLHSCISNSNENNNTNDNHSQLITRRNENINGNNYHSVKDNLGQPQRQLGSCNLWLYLLIEA